MGCRNNNRLDSIDIGCRRFQIDVVIIHQFFAEELLDYLAPHLEIHDVIDSTAHGVDGHTVIREAVSQLDVCVVVTPDDGGLLEYKQRWLSEQTNRTEQL